MTHTQFWIIPLFLGLSLYKGIWADETKGKNEEAQKFIESLKVVSSNSVPSCKLLASPKEDWSWNWSGQPPVKGTGPIECCYKEWRDYHYCYRSSYEDNARSGAQKYCNANGPTCMFDRCSKLKAQ